MKKAILLAKCQELGSVMNSRRFQLIELHSISNSPRGMQDIELAMVSQRAYDHALARVGRDDGRRELAAGPWPRKV
jgi:hypothetical protein